MDKLGIITLNGYFNFGNRLQNYALSYVCSRLGFDVYTIWDKDIGVRIKDYIKQKCFFVPKYNRYRKFYRFSKKYIKEDNLKSKRGYKYIVIGSDQVWNPKYITEKPFLLYEPEAQETVITYAVSFGVESLPESFEVDIKSHCDKYKRISVREHSGEKILSNIGVANVNCVLDPTLLLTRDDWDSIKKMPKNFKRGQKYILKYFLGDIQENEEMAILDFASQNGCDIIDLKDQNDSLFCVGPDEFLYLIDNAYLICTDSFHACVFSLIYDKSFVVFKRRGCSDYMYSRISNLLTTFNLNNREFNGNFISYLNKEHDYSEASVKLIELRNKSIKYIKDNVRTE